VEEKLRQRGLGPCYGAERIFARWTRSAGRAITEGRDPESPPQPSLGRFGKLKKSGQDASALMAETKDLREQIQTGRKLLPTSMSAWEKFSPEFPTFPRQRTRGNQRGAERGSSPLGPDAAVRLHCEAALGTRRAVRCARSGARRQAYGRTIRGLLGSGGKA